MFGVLLTKIFLIMNNVFKLFNDFVKGLTGVILGLLALGVAATLVFGDAGLMGIDVIANISSVLGELADPAGGVGGLIVLLIVWGLLSK